MDNRVYIKQYFAKSICSGYLYPSSQCTAVLHIGEDDSDYNNIGDDFGDDYDISRSGKVIKP